MAISFSLLQVLGLGGTIIQRISDALDPPSSFNPAFYRDNFAGQGSCGGTKQSPIQLPATGPQANLANRWKTDIKMPTAITGATIENKGTGFQINWDPLDFDLTVDQFPKVPVVAGANSVTASQEAYDAGATVDRYLTMVPVQMHWHVVSEHSLNGNYAALEAHIVTFVAPNQATEWGCDGTWDENQPINLNNCIAVFGVAYDLGGTTPGYLQSVINEYNAGGLNAVGDKKPFPGTLNLDALLPSVRSHYTYPGSLTTPPCTETLLWHVMDTMLPITADAQIALEQMVAQTFDSSDPNVKNNYRHNNRPVLPQLGRTVFLAS